MSVARYRVKDGIRVVVAGKPFSNGQTFSAEPADVTDLLASGWISEAGSKAVHGDQVEDKAVPTARRRSPRKSTS